MADLSKKDSFRLPSSAKSHWDVWVHDQQYNQIKGITRNGYAVKDKEGNAIQLVELRFEFQDRAGDWYKAFKAQDGNHILQLLNTAMQCGGKLATEPVAGSTDASASEIVRLIEALGELRKADVLTEQEFEQKKSQLLAQF